VIDLDAKACLVERVELSERIVRWRESRDGLTQAALAKKIGISPSAVAQWELGQTVPTTDNLAKIAKALGVSLAAFWGDPPKKKREARAS
jgi:transcriptional regulator with XRE-family HTH domain